VKRGKARDHPRVYKAGIQAFIVIRVVTKEFDADSR